MKNAQFFLELRRELEAHGHCTIGEAALPDALLGSEAEVDIRRIIPALLQTAAVGHISSPNLYYPGTEVPAQVAALLHIMTAAKLEALGRSSLIDEQKNRVYQDIFIIFCLAYEAPNAQAFKLVIERQRNTYIFLRPLATTVA
ncbi:MAG: hypothetical protein WCV85_01385 [Patescibacteria group bacterium]|jgi:hypothetical protein